MSLLQKKYTTLIPPTLSQLQTHKKPLLLATVAAPLLAYAISCYRQWLAIGKGGVPYNFLGWLAQSSLHLIARSDTQRPVPKSFKRVEDVAALYGPAGGKSYFSSGFTLETRKGETPVVPGFVAPQRQTSDVPSGGMIGRETAFLSALAHKNPVVFELQTSTLEGPPHKALWLRPGQTLTEEEKRAEEKFHVRLGYGSKGEWAHVHGEGSAHVTLSPVDAAAVIEKGWGRRHPLSGVGGRWARAPWGYVFLYAPRDEAEWGVWREIVLASARYVAEGAGVEVEVPE
ncbi:hypothetical protein F5Y06DRAFT_28158 [Hypoxylon sp. FL0890]|nr:hypothetical protein F5Y06DRAFT_28158 [Hypoxylon sp. FL0890]